jgi:hypothetical protein
MLSEIRWKNGDAGADRYCTSLGFGFVLDFTFDFEFESDEDLESLVCLTVCWDGSDVENGVGATCGDEMDWDRFEEDGDGLRCCPKEIEARDDGDDDEVNDCEDE